jgi:hypothetical protein
MASCGSCGASTNPNNIICGFCGIATQEIESAADELRALSELNKVAQSMVDKSSSNSGIMGAMTSNLKDQMGQGNEARIATFWKNAFIPRTIDAQSQAIVQMLSLIVVPEGIQEIYTSSFSASARKAESIYFDRAEAILTAMRIQHAGDSEAATKIAVLEQEIQKERDKIKAARKKGFMIYGVFAVGLVLILGIMNLVTKT